MLYESIGDFMINIKADSRRIKKGDIFIALRGISSDGHEYIQKAISLGASKLIVEDDGDYSIPYEIVKDTRKYLEEYLKDNYQKYLNEYNRSYWNKWQDNNMFFNQ